MTDQIGKPVSKNTWYFMEGYAWVSVRSSVNKYVWDSVWSSMGAPVWFPIKNYMLEDLTQRPCVAKKGEMKMEQKPSIGRVVHYQRYGTPGGEHKQEPSPAVITKVLDDKGTCQLFVMNPNGLYFNETPFSDVPKPGHWNWPPRV